jgi:hypothetical protein
VLQPGPDKSQLNRCEWTCIKTDKALHRLAYHDFLEQYRLMCPPAPQDLIEQLASLLAEVGNRAGPDFSGIGLIVTTSSDSLPIIALRPVSKLIDGTDTALALSRISYPWHEQHDGFHILTPDLKIIKVSQYFSPPIEFGARIDRSKRFGGRYLAALFGSMLPGVVATGISSRDFGLAVFQGGHEKVYRATSALLLRTGGAYK